MAPTSDSPRNTNNQHHLDIVLLTTLNMVAQPIFHAPNNPLLQPPCLQFCYKEATGDHIKSLAKVQMNIHCSPLVRTASHLLGECNGVVPQIVPLTLLEDGWDICLSPGVMSLPRSPGLFKDESAMTLAGFLSTFRCFPQPLPLGLGPGRSEDRPHQPKSRQEQHPVPWSFPCPLPLSPPLH